jgi:hypothetical protein
VWPDYVVLSRITIGDGGTNENFSSNRVQKKFVAELQAHPYPAIQANENAAVVIFNVRYGPYVIEVATNLTGISNSVDVPFTNWQQVAGGTNWDTNASIIIVDLHGGQRPQQFWRQR